MAERLAAFKVPTLITFSEEQLPRGATGKILKRELRATILYPDAKAAELDARSTSPVLDGEAGDHLLLGDGPLGARPRPRKLTVQWASADTRFLKPVRKVRWTTSQASQPTNPLSRTGPILATPRKREIVAIEPRSR